MSCENQDILTVSFPEHDLELRPSSYNLRVDRGKLNLLQTTFSFEVGEYLKSLMDDVITPLSSAEPVNVKINGTKRFFLMYRPQDVRFGRDNCHIDFHDPQKGLDLVSFDSVMKTVTLEEAYTEIFNSSNFTNVFRGIKFDTPDWLTPDKIDDVNNGFVENKLKYPTINPDSSSKETGVTAINGDDGSNNGGISSDLLEGTYSFDIYNKTCYEAIWYLNNEFNITSWTGSDGNLHVGLPENNEKTHICAPDDKRVWKFTNINTTPPTNRIKRVIVKGAIIDAPNKKTQETDFEDTMEHLVPSASDDTKNKHKDLVPIGVAERDDVDIGQTISFNREQAKIDSLEPLAYHLLLSKLREQRGGTVQIDPKLSGSEVSDCYNVSIGERLHVLPSDKKSSNCHSPVRNETYMIDGIKYSNNGPSVNMNVHINRFPDNSVTTKTLYHDPVENDYLDENFNETNAGL